MLTLLGLGTARPICDGDVGGGIDDVGMRADWRAVLGGRGVLEDEGAM